jgi:methylated-DNA-[protein]-cysteine S-methyltransferase
MNSTARQLLAGLPDPDAASLERLHVRLASAAAIDASLDIAYRTVDSPLGTLLLAATPTGLLRVAYASEGHDDVLAALSAQVSPRVLRAPARLDPAAHAIEEYFAGQRRRFDLALDLQLARGFRREVLDWLPSISYAGTASYSAVAAGTGRPAAVRAVGTACARNPMPIVIPCHRVVKSDGSIGAYLGGVAAKQALLSLESRTAATD